LGVEPVAGCAHLGERGTTSRIVDDVSDHTLDVAMALGEILRDDNVVGGPRSGVSENHFWARPAHFFMWGGSLPGLSRICSETPARCASDTVTPCSHAAHRLSRTMHGTTTQAHHSPSFGCCVPPHLLSAQFAVTARSLTPIVSSLKKLLSILFLGSPALMGSRVAGSWLLVGCTHVLAMLGATLPLRGVRGEDGPRTLTLASDDAPHLQVGREEGSARCV